MAKYVLEILDGDRAGEIIPVTDRALRVGRKPSNDVILSDEKTSGVHAEIVLEGDRHVLRDLGSTNGTFLDEKRVTELVLTAGDVVTIGRLRIKFRDEQSASAGGDGDFAMHRIDAGRVQKRGGSLVLLGLLAVVGAGVGGYLWWSGRQVEENVGRVAKQHDPESVPGNKLAQAVAAAETEAGWNLRAHGLGFQPTGRAHTGKGAFEAVRGEGSEAADYAVANLAEPLAVLSGRSVTVAAWLETVGAAQVGVRAVCFSSNEQNPLRFRTGTTIAATSGWERREASLAVPPGCDRLQIELVALIGDVEAVARVDDVAVTEGGTGAAIEQQLSEGRQTALGTGTALAVKSADPDNPVTMLEVLPGTVAAPFRALHAAGLGALSDIGAQVSCASGTRSLTIEATGAADLEFVFPAESAGQLVVQKAAGEAFEAVAPEAQCTAVALLFGNRGTRAMLSLAAPAACTGRVGNGVYRLHIAATKAELVLGFYKEREQALDLLRNASKADTEGRAGAALDILRQLQRTVPQDSEALAQAAGLRAQILAGQADALQRLKNELTEAMFFDTRGGFERVVQGVDGILALYGEGNVEDMAAVGKLREDAATRLAVLDGAQQTALQKRLDELGKAFAEAGQAGLAKLVNDYRPGK